MTRNALVAVALAGALAAASSPAQATTIQTSFATADGFVTGSIAPFDLTNGDFTTTFSGGQQQQSVDAAAYNAGPDAWMVVNGTFLGSFANVVGAEDKGLIEFNIGATEVSFVAGDFGVGNPVVRAFGLDGVTELGSVTVTQTDMRPSASPTTTVFRSSDFGGALIGAIEIDNAGPGATPPYVAAIDTFSATAADHVATTFDNQTFTTGSISPQVVSDGNFDVTFTGGQQQQSVDAAAYNLGPDAWMVVNGTFVGSFANVTGAEDQGTIEFDPPAAEVSFVAGNFGIGVPEIRVLAVDGSTVLATEMVTQTDIRDMVGPTVSLFRASDLGEPIGSIVLDNAGPAGSPPYVIAIDTFAATVVPEPGSGLLLAATAMALWGVSRRRRASLTP